MYSFETGDSKAVKKMKEYEDIFEEILDEIKSHLEQKHNRVGTGFLLRLETKIKETIKGEK